MNCEGAGREKCLEAAESDETLSSVRTIRICVAERAHSCLHTPWNTGLFEMLTGSQLVKKFPAL
jgi:hypothetical protein